VNGKVKIDFSIQPNVLEQSADGLLECAQLMCRELDYDAVALGIAEPFNSLLAPSATGALWSPDLYMAVSASLRDGNCIQTGTGLIDPIAAGELGFRLYVGLPLRLASGINGGTLAVLSRKPRHLAENELQDLKIFRDMIVQFVELCAPRPAGVVIN
jgi:hypothetical protein